jgi:hypothetical protein
LGTRSVLEFDSHSLLVFDSHSLLKKKHRWHTHRPFKPRTITQDHFTHKTVKNGSDKPCSRFFFAKIFRAYPHALLGRDFKILERETDTTTQIQSFYSLFVVSNHTHTHTHTHTSHTHTYTHITHTHITHTHTHITHTSHTHITHTHIHTHTHTQISSMSVSHCALSGSVTSLAERHAPIRKGKETILLSRS